MNYKMAFSFLCYCLLFVSCSDTDSNRMTCPECSLEPNVGPCNAAFVRYYFDTAEGKCKEFTWGGCAGVVPFETLEECQACDC